MAVIDLLRFLAHTNSLSSILNAMRISQALFMRVGRQDEVDEYEVTTWA